MFFKYRNDQRLEPLINELCRKEEGIMRAEKEVAKLDRSWLKYMRNVSKEKDRIDRMYEEIRFQKALDEAREKLREEAHFDKEKTIARNALAEGLSPDIIQKITGLSLEEIAKL